MVFFRLYFRADALPKTGWVFSSSRFLSGFRLYPLHQASPAITTSAKFLPVDWFFQENLQDFSEFDAVFPGFRHGKLLVFPADFRPHWNDLQRQRICARYWQGVGKRKTACDFLRLFAFSQYAEKD